MTSRYSSRPMPTMSMRLPIDPKGEFKFNEPPPYVQNSQGDGMAVDKAGRFYVTSKLGVQVFVRQGKGRKDVGAHGSRW